MNIQDIKRMKLRVVLPLWIVGVLLTPGVAMAQETALDRYIAKPDPSYSWKLANTISGQGYKGYVIDLTSQTWRSAAEVDRPVVEALAHDRQTRQDHVQQSAAVYRRRQQSRCRTHDDERAFRRFRDGDRTPWSPSWEWCPNQPLFFADSKDKGRSEDDLIAYTRVKQMATRDDDVAGAAWRWSRAECARLMRFRSFMSSEAGGKLKVDQFVVSGGSKRGWTTWLVGVVDKRVIAIMPTVIDALNSEVITRHHYEAYGFFSTVAQRLRQSQTLSRQDRHARVSAHPGHRRRVQLSQSRAAQDPEVPG